MFDTSSSPIRTLADIYAVQSASISDTGYFAPGYLESGGEAIVGSPIVSDDDSGHVIIRKAGGSYCVTYYQRTHYMEGIGLHNYHEGSRTFKHVSSARRYARSL